MKGVIISCAEQLVKSGFGPHKWTAVLEKAGIDKNEVFMATMDYEDQTALKVVGAICDVLGLGLQEVADAFGDYWVNQYAAKMYKLYYLNISSAREFLLNMPVVHEKTTRSIPNAKPPMFEYEWKNDKTLVMKYISQRDLIEFVAGLIRGVGKHYGERLGVRIIDRKNVEVVFN